MKLRAGGAGGAGGGGALLVGALVAVAIGAACTAFNDARLPQDAGPIVGGQDGGTSSSSSSSGGGREAGCPVVRVPDRGPSIENDTVKTEFVVTIHNLGLGISGTQFAYQLDQNFGYDLDNSCSCKPDPESCAGPANVGMDSGRLEGCDLNGGRDNATGKMLVTIPIEKNPAIYANEAIDQGQKGILLRVLDYNGEANDGRVRLLIYRSAGTQDTGGNPRAPNFADPTDEWTIDKDDLVLGGSDPFDGRVTGVGWVANNRLIASLKSSSFPFNTDADIKLTEVQLTADLVKDGSGNYSLANGVAVGRWPVKDVIDTVARVQDPQNAAQRLCKSAFFSEVKNKVCAAVDIFDIPKDDNTGQPCNALSTAVSFVGSAAKLGKAVTPTRQNPCAGTTLGECQ